MALMNATDRPLNDAMLAKTRQQIDAKIPARWQRDHLAIVVAGMELMYSEETYRMAVNAMAAVIKSKPPQAAAALATVSLIAMIYRESQQKMSVPASFSAALVLLCYVLEYLEQAQGITITPKLFAQASAATTLGLFKLFGITQQQLTQATQGQPPSQATPQPTVAAQGGA